MSILSAALDYAGRGLPVFPCNPRSKVPLTAHGFKDATTDGAKIRAWWSKNPKALIGVPTGSLTHRFVLDADGNEGVQALAELERKYGSLPPTTKVVTRPGRFHLYFRQPDGVKTKCSASEIAPKLDVRGDGGYAIMPPSPHPQTGKPYIFERDGDPAEAPEWLLRLVTEKPSSPKNKTQQTTIPKGQRNQTLTSLAGAMRARGMLHEAIEAALLMENLACSPPLPEREVRAIAKSISRYEPGATCGLALTDLGNAERLVAQHGTDLKFCASRGWLVWDGVRWRYDDTGEVERRAKLTIRTIYQEAATESDDTRRKEIAAWAKRSEAEPRIKAMIELAKTEPGIPVRIEELDGDRLLLNCANGVVDLTTGELLPHQPGLLMTKLCPVNFDPRALCERFENFLVEIFSSGGKGSSAATIEYLQRAVGYAVTGSTREQVVHILYGTGANGKTTLLETIRKIMGDYGAQANMSTFMVARNEGIPNDIARLSGIRFVAAAEVEAGRRLSESLIKSLTGGDAVLARFLHREFFEFMPQFKIFLAVNHKPVIRGTDLAIWRRVRLIPFNRAIPEEQQDKGLGEKMAGELPGILAWVVRGCLRWQRDGLDAPSEITAATADYRDEMDMVGRFVADRCELKPVSKTSAAALFEAYAIWCGEQGEQPLGKRTFGQRLRDRGLTPGREGGGARVWVGIGLVTYVT